MKPNLRALGLMLSLVALGAASAQASRAGSAPDSARHAVTLGRTTRIEASHHSRVLLRVPEEIPLRELTTRISGGGRVAGFVLTNKSQGRDEEEGFLVESFAFNRCVEPGCPAAKQPLQVRFSEGLVNGVIPPGTYRLYIVADQAPVAITFRDPYLRGRHLVRVGGNHVDVEIQSLPMSTAAGEGTLFSGGGFTDLRPGHGIGLLGLWAMGSNYLGGAYGNCFYFAAPVVPEERTAFLPGCPGGWAPSRFAQGPASPGERGGVVYESTHHRLPMGIGGWAASAADVDDFGAVGLWLRF